MSTDAQLPSLGAMLEGAVTFTGGFVAVFLPLGVVAFGAFAALALVLVPLAVGALAVATAAVALAVPVLLVRAAARRIGGWSR